MSRTRPARGQYPPDWERQAGSGSRPYLDRLDELAATPWGAARLELWQKLPDATERELAWALAPLPFHPGLGVERVRALRAALAEISASHPELAGVTVQTLAAVPVRSRSSAAAIVAAVVAATSPALPASLPSSDPATSLRLRRRRDLVAGAHAGFRVDHDGRHPSQLELANRLELTARQLRRWVADDPYLKRYVPTRLGKAAEMSG